jgi:hypothetical protein
LPELVLIEGNQQVAMKPDESLSPSFFIHLSFAFSRRSPQLVLRFYDSDTVSKRLITVSDKFRTDLSATV